MKERLYDIIKWTIVMSIAGLIFYMVFPKYHFISHYARGNRITGDVEVFSEAHGWTNLQKTIHRGSDIDIDDILRTIE